MENAQIIERLRNLVSNLHRTAVKIHNPERRAAFADSDVRDCEAMLDALAKSIELSPSATQAPPVPVDGLADLTRRLEELWTSVDLIEGGHLADLYRRVSALETTAGEMRGGYDSSIGILLRDRGWTVVPSDSLTPIVAAYRGRHIGVIVDFAAPWLRASIKCHDAVTVCRAGSANDLVREIEEWCAR